MAGKDNDRRNIRATTLSILFLSVLVVLSTSELLAGESVQIDGIRHVRNSATPAGGTRVLELEELWRAGGEDDEMIFGLLTQVLGDEDGNVYLLDAQLHQVFVYSPEGQLIRSLFREGDGPGEIRAPRDMLFLPDGAIGVVQQFPGKVISVDRQGNPKGSLVLGGDDPTKGGVSIVLSAQAQAGTVVLACMGQTFVENTQVRTNYLASFSPSGTELNRYLEEENRVDFSQPVFSEKRHHLDWLWTSALGFDGTLFVAPHRDQYLIEVYGSDGRLQRTIEREFVPTKRTGEEKHQMKTLVEQAFRGVPFEIEFEVEDTEPVIGWRHRGIRPMLDGHLWVLTSEGVRMQPDSIMATFDVFDPDGNFKEQVAVACPGNSLRDGLFFVGNDRAVLIKGFVDAMGAMVFMSGVIGKDEDEEPEPMSVICYRIVKD
jgi:hypothetical protein